MMKKDRFRKRIGPLQASEKKLRCGGGHEILTADNEIDPVIQIIYQADQLIGRQIVLPPEDKIPHGLAEHHHLSSHPQHASLWNQHPNCPPCSGRGSAFTAKPRIYPRQREFFDLAP